MPDPSVMPVHVSAPGKLMLLGEHAVVYGHPCLVTAMDARLHMTLALAAPGDATVTISAPDVGVDRAQRPLAAVFADGHAMARGTRFVESALAVFREAYSLPRGIVIETRSDFSSQYGLGSSSATVACVLFGLAQVYGLDVPPLRLFEMGLDAIRRAQQMGSGFDLAAAIYGGTLYYAPRQPREIVPLDAPALPLVVAYSGVKADTPTYVQGVKLRFAAWPDAVAGIFDVMAQLARDGRGPLERGDWAQLGELMDMQHGLAHALGVDVAKTAELVFAARDAGAYGAKLSGAGGGDCIIALAPDERRAAVEAALVAAGGEIVRITPGAPGIRRDEEA